MLKETINNIAGSMVKDPILNRNVKSLYSKEYIQIILEKIVNNVRINKLITYMKQIVNSEPSLKYQLRGPSLERLWQ